MANSDSFPSEIKTLGEKYLVQELGLSSEELSNNTRELVGFFHTLLRIDERINKERTLGKL